MLASVLVAGCGSGGLSLSSNCGEFNDAAMNDQIRFIRAEFGPHQVNPDLTDTQVFQAEEVMDDHCDANPDASLKTIPYQIQLGG